MSKKFLKYEDTEPEIREMYPDIDIWVSNNRNEELCGISKLYQIGRKKQPAAIFYDGFHSVYFTSDCLRQLADKLDSLNES